MKLKYLNDIFKPIHLGIGYFTFRGLRHLLDIVLGSGTIGTRNRIWTECHLSRALEAGHADRGRFFSEFKEEKNI